MTNFVTITHPKAGSTRVPASAVAGWIARGWSVGGTPPELPADVQDDATDTPDAPAESSSKAAWVDHAVSFGMDRDEAEQLTRAELITRFSS